MCLFLPGTRNLSINLLTESGNCVINILVDADGRVYILCHLLNKGENNDKNHNSGSQSILSQLNWR